MRFARNTKTHPKQPPNTGKQQWNFRSMVFAWRCSNICHVFPVIPFNFTICAKNLAKTCFDLSLLCPELVVRQWVNIETLWLIGVFDMENHNKNCNTNPQHVFAWICVDWGEPDQRGSFFSKMCVSWEDVFVIPANNMKIIETMCGFYCLCKFNDWRSWFFAGWDLQRQQQRWSTTTKNVDPTPQSVHAFLRAGGMFGIHRP